MLQDAAKGQPDWLCPWFNFWINLVSAGVTFFSVATAVDRDGIGLALILGFARKLTYVHEVSSSRSFGDSSSQFFSKEPSVTICLDFHTSAA